MSGLFDIYGKCGFCKFVEELEDFLPEGPCLMKYRSQFDDAQNQYHKEIKAVPGVGIKAELDPNFFDAERLQDLAKSLNENGQEQLAKTGERYLQKIKPFIAYLENHGLDIEISQPFDPRFPVRTKDCPSFQNERRSE